MQSPGPKFRQKEPKVEQEKNTERIIQAMDASCATSAPSCLALVNPYAATNLAKELAPCRPSPTAAAVRVNAAKLPPGVSETSKNIPGNFL